GDFECHSMGNIGGDEYGIEVPARTVTDAFAYYLEAWDNNDNGPARSGAPELPRAIVLDEPVPVAVSPGVAVQPPESGDVVAARFNPVPTPPLVIVDRKLPAHLPPAAGQGDWTMTVLLGGDPAPRAARRWRSPSSPSASWPPPPTTWTSHRPPTPRSVLPSRRSRAALASACASRRATRSSSTTSPM